MQRAVAHQRPRKMAVLGMIEFTLSFTVIYAITQAAGVSITLPGIDKASWLGNIPLDIVLTSIVGGIAETIGFYRPEVCLDRNRLLTATGVSAAIAFSLLLFQTHGPPPGTSFSAINLAKAFAAWLTILALSRLAYGHAMSREPSARRVLLLGSPAQVSALDACLQSRRGQSYEPVVLHGQALSWALLRQQRIWSVVIVSEPDAGVVEPLMDCKLRGMQILDAAAFQENHLRRVDLNALMPAQLLISDGFAAGRVTAAAKRLCDLAIGIPLLALALPLMALTVLAIKMDSRGPVFYCQRRVGHSGRVFTLFKFRSMTANAEAGGPRWAQQHDPRATRVGRFIRATRIDELPQLANVIRGEMSMVGPRPERPHFVEQLVKTIPFYRHRSYVKPGLTGWAQVNFPYGASVSDAREKLAYDLYYVKHRSIMLDMVILLSTIRVVLFREGAH